MPRTARLVLPEYPHHIIHRGNNRERVFRSDKDHKVYLNLIGKFAKKWSCEVLAFCLMPNHVHLLLIPKQKDSLAKMMQGLALTYTQFFNKKYKRTGRIWESRFHSSIVDRDAYLWSVLRYIETNPVRAGLTTKLQRYKWSSAKIHLTNQDNDLVKSIYHIKHRFGIFEGIDYRQYLEETIEQSQYEYIHRMSIKEKPIGKDAFIKKLEGLFKIKLLQNHPGRPKKNKENKGLQNGTCP